MAMSGIKRKIKTKAKNGKWSERTVTSKTIHDYLNNVFVADNGCQLWLGSTGSGYPRPRIDGELAMLHRLSYAHRYGPIPAYDPRGLIVCHSCGNRLCINPQHMYLGFAKDNALDMVSHGTAGKLKGEDIGNSKLKENDVKKIRQNVSSNFYLAKKYNVTAATISNVKTNKTWRHI